MKRTDPPQKLYDLEKLKAEFKANIVVIEYDKYPPQEGQDVLEKYWPEKFLALEVA